MINREHLEALRHHAEEEHRRAEEEYGLDIAAIDWLERRFTGTTSSISSDTPGNSVPLESHSSPNVWSECESGAAWESLSVPPSVLSEPVNGDLVSSLRTIFKAGGNGK